MRPVNFLLLFLFIFPSVQQSPNRTYRIAYQGWGQCGSQQGCPYNIILLDPDTGMTETLNAGVVFLDSLQWSPNYDRLLFITASGIATIGISDQSPIFLGTSDSSSSPHWSPDGKHIAFHAPTDSLTDECLYLVESNGENEQTLNCDLDFYNGSPIWTPDGKSITFTAQKTFSDPFSIYSLELRTLSVRDLLEAKLPSGYFSQNHNINQTLVIVSRNTDSSGLYLINQDGSNFRKLFEDTEQMVAPQLVLNDRFVTYWVETKNGDMLYLLNIETQTSTELLDGLIENSGSDISPDGNELVYIGRSPDEPASKTEVCIIHLSDGSKRCFDGNPFYNAAPVWGY